MLYTWSSVDCLCMPPYGHERDNRRYSCPSQSSRRTISESIIIGLRLAWAAAAAAGESKLESGSHRLPGVWPGERGTAASQGPMAGPGNWSSFPTQNVDFRHFITQSKRFTGKTHFKWYLSLFKRFVEPCTVMSRAGSINPLLSSSQNQE